MHPAKILYWRN